MEVYWHAVTYKTVALYATLIFIIIVAGMYLAKPDWTNIITKKVSDALGNPETENSPVTMTQAKFVNLDGRVQVKKVNSVTWVDADYHTTLDKGDLIQTGNDGAARITFADGTEYTIKSETMLTVEENNVTRDHSNTAVRINTGTVDLATPNWSSPDSKASVSVEDATAYMKQNSRATVKNDPKENEHEIVVSTGSAEVQRGNEKIELTQWEKASFPSGGVTTKSNVLAPPGLVAPLNLAPIISETPRTAQIRFEWQSVEGAVSYTLRISTTTMFTKLVKEVKVTGTSADVTGLDPGDYFWNVTASNAKKEVSDFSEIFKFSLVAQGQGAGHDAADRVAADSRARGGADREDGTWSGADYQRPAGGEYLAGREFPALHGTAGAGAAHHCGDRVQSARRNGEAGNFHRRAEIGLGRPGGGFCVDRRIRRQWKVASWDVGTTEILPGSILSAGGKQ